MERPVVLRHLVRHGPVHAGSTTPLRPEVRFRAAGRDDEEWGPWIRGDNRREEAAMEERYVWVTTRRLKSGTLDVFGRAWRPEQRPEGMEQAFAYWSADGREVTGVSFWGSKESCDRWRASEAEARRREAMASYVVEESEAFYEGRELGLPDG